MVPAKGGAVMRHRVRAAAVKADEMRPRLQDFGIGAGVNVAGVGGGVNATLGKSRHRHDADVAKKVLIELADHRVLYAPYHMEIEYQCIDSVQRMRQRLTDRMGELDQDSPLMPQLRQIRRSCRLFLDETAGPGAHGFGIAPWESGDFMAALGALRASVGLCLAVIAERYGLDVEAELAPILPPAPTDQD